MAPGAWIPSSNNAGSNMEIKEPQLQLNEVFEVNRMDERAEFCIDVETVIVQRNVYNPFTVIP